MRESEENEDSVDKLDSANRDSVSPGISAATSGSAAFSSSSSSSASSLAAKKAAMSSQAQSRMAILSSACKKHEFVPFTKDGHTVFVKFAIDMEETRWTTGSVASFVIRLLTEGNWFAGGSWKFLSITGISSRYIYLTIDIESLSEDDGNDDIGQEQ